MPTPRAMVPQDLTRIRFASDPQIAPDGRTVAFVVTTLSEDKDEYLSNIWVVSATGGEPRRFTTGPRRDTSPALVARRLAPGLHLRARARQEGPAPRDAGRAAARRPASPISGTA